MGGGGDRKINFGPVEPQPGLRTHLSLSHWAEEAGCEALPATRPAASTAHGGDGETIRGLRLCSGRVCLALLGRRGPRREPCAAPSITGLFVPNPLEARAG